MAAEKEPDPKVEYSDTKLKQSSRKTKVAVITALTVVLLLGAVISVALYFTLKDVSSSANRLTEVNLNKDDTLTYQVDQDIEAQAGNDKQKGTIRATVGLRVLNKTSEGYWFLVKFNVSEVGGDVDIIDVNETIDFFLVRLHLDSRNTSHASNESGVSFEIYGTNSTDDEKLRLVFAILQQLLPAVKRDLYENVDGKKGVNSPNPEESPLLPDPVKMHREANTSDKDTVSIKNHFDRSDFVRKSSQVDLDVKYSDFTLIKKSNGMVSESRVRFSEQLNFGESIHSNDGGEIAMMKITLTSRVSLIKTQQFEVAELEVVGLHVFIKLVVPKAVAPVSVNETQSQGPSDVSLPSPPDSQDNSSAVPLKRSRRSVAYNASNVNASVISEIWDRIPPVCLTVNRTSFVLFQKRILGVRVRAIASLSVNIDGDGPPEIEVELKLVVGWNSLTVFRKNYTIPPQIGMGYNLTLPERSETLIFWHRVWGIWLRIKFYLRFRVSFLVSFPSDGNSLDPLKLKVKVEPIANIYLRIQGLYSYRGYQVGASGAGTLIRVGLPVTLSFCDGKLCVSLSVRLTALQLRAHIYVIRRRCRKLLLVRVWKCLRYRWIGWWWNRRRVCSRWGWRWGYEYRWVWCPPRVVRRGIWFIVKTESNLLQVCNKTKNITITPSISPSTSMSPSASLSPSMSISTSMSISRSTSISLSASISLSTSVSTSTSISRSASTSASTSISRSTSISPSTSTSLSTSTSASTSTSRSTSISPSTSISISTSTSASTSISRSTSISPSTSVSRSTSIAPSASISRSTAISPSPASSSRLVTSSV